MIKKIVVSSIAVLSIVVLAGPVSSASAANHFVPVSNAHTGFGAFREGGHAVSRLVRAFGSPSGRHRTAYGCTLRWKKKGIKVELSSYGLTSSPCSDGYFSTARLTKKSWHTGNGVRVGSRASKAKRFAVINCMGARARKNFNCLRRKGYVLGLHRSECAAGRFPTVTAQIRNGRVSGLFIWSHSCE